MKYKIAIILSLLIYTSCNNNREANSKAEFWKNKLISLKEDFLNDTTLSYKQSINRDTVINLFELFSNEMDSIKQFNLLFTDYYRNLIYKYKFLESRELMDDFSFMDLNKNNLEDDYLLVSLKYSILNNVIENFKFPYKFSEVEPAVLIPHKNLSINDTVTLYYFISTGNSMNLIESIKTADFDYEVERPYIDSSMQTPKNNGYRYFDDIIIKDKKPIYHFMIMKVKNPFYNDFTYVKCVIDSHK